MPMLPSRRRVWAIAYTVTLVVAAPLLFVQQSWSKPASAPREGIIHLKRGQETVDVDSLLDTHQPDFFLRIEMNPPTPTPSSARAPERIEAPASAEPQSPISPERPASERPAPAAAMPAPASQAAPVEATATPLPAASTPPSARLQIVADALYHAPRLARQGRYREALEMVENGLAVDEAVAPLHALRGSLYFKLGREAQAEEGWARALELDPGLKDAREALEWIRNRRR